ncbi:MAG TPA: DegT/DnrJ/EryC1/StrS aminotransferase family protein [Baekduia sp.]|nr:DegT/DnrJ/EryC1/StrS aminotransferase family protein [Baekduia sp.]
MPQWSVPLADVVVPEEDIAAVAEVLRSGWLTMGPVTAAFEEDLKAYTGAAHAFAVTNGTAALHLLCLAAELGPGDEVIVPSMTFVATANAIAYTGATPVFADVADVLRPWLSAAAAEAAITPRTKAIMAMSYGGHPGEIRALAAVAERHGLLLLEDGAHGLGAREDDRHVGTFGFGGAFSFFGNKNLPVGEGGAVVVQDDVAAARVKLLRSHGMTTLTWDRHRGHASTYDVVALGYNDRIDEPRAALARAGLRRLDEGNRRRAALDARYRDALAGVDGVEPTEAPPASAVGAHHLFTVVLDPSLDRDAFRTALAERGVQTSQHYPPAHRFEIYREAAAELPVTDAYARRTVTLPLFPTMTDEQLERVVAASVAALADAAPV